MHIKKVEIDGFAMFDKTLFELEKKENIIVGTNGVGKTIFLQLLNHVFTNIDVHQPCQTNFKKQCDNHINIYIVLNDNDRKNIISIYALFFILENNNKINFSNNYYGENIEKINEELKKFNDISCNNILIDYKEIDKPSINIKFIEDNCKNSVHHKYSNIKDCDFSQITDNIRNYFKSNNSHNNVNIYKLKMFLRENFLNDDVLLLLNNYLIDVEDTYNINNVEIDMENIFDLERCAF